MKQKQILEDRLIVITGAAGFIGSGVVRYLNDQGYENLLLVDRLNDGTKWKNLLGKKFVEIVLPEDFFDWVVDREREIGAFIHLGACSGTTECDADFLLKNNYRFSIRLCEYAMRNGHRFIYASSAATYGDGKQGFSDSHNNLEKLCPMNMYGFSKHLFDLWIKRKKLLDRVVGLKYFNVFGPNEYHKGRMASLIYRMFNQVRDTGKIGLFKSNDSKYKDGDQYRDFIYVKDVVRMTCLLLEDAWKDVSGIFNIGRGEPVTWNKMAHAFFDAMGKKMNIQYIDMPKDLIRQYQNYTRADMNKYLGLHKGEFQFTPVEEAVKDYVQNYLQKDHRTW